MSGSGSALRSQNLAKRCARLYAEGCTLSEIADITGIDREKIKTRIELGQRLISLEEDKP